MAENPTHHARMKYVEIDHHFVREKVMDGSLQVNYVPSHKQVADALTKPLTPTQFAPLREALRVLPLSFNTVENRENNRVCCGGS